MRKKFDRFRRFVKTRSEVAVKDKTIDGYIRQLEMMKSKYGLKLDRKKGLDKHLPSSGLAVYHCDIEGSNEWQAGSPNYHYQCALLQADGHRDMEANLNRGDEGDLFGKTEGLTLSRKSNPSVLSLSPSIRRISTTAASNWRLCNRLMPSDSVPAMKHSYSPSLFISR